MAEIIKFFDRQSATQQEIDERVEHLVLFNSLLALIREHGIVEVCNAMEEVDTSFMRGVGVGFGQC